MSVRNLESFFQPRSIAVIGTDYQPRSIGRVVAQNLFAGDFAGPVLPVDHHRQAVQGVMTWPSVPALPIDPELAVIATPANEVPATVAALAARRTKAAIVLSTDFDCCGAEAGARLRQDMLAAAAPSAMRIVGPSCLGVVVPRAGLNASLAHAKAAAGSLAFLTQSGTVMGTILDWAGPRHIGFSVLAALGDMADVDFGDLLDFLTFDPATRAVLLCMERIREPRELLSAARAIARVKPVIVLKVGTLISEPEPTSTLPEPPRINPDLAANAAFRRAGLLPVPALEDLIAAAETLTGQTRIAGDRLALISNGRGGGVLVSDELRRRGGQPAQLDPETIGKLDRLLPPGWGSGDPVNVFSDAPAERYGEALAIVLDDPGCDAVLVVNSPTALGDPVATARAVAGKGRRTKPVFALWLHQQQREACERIFAEANIPCHQSPADAIGAFSHIVAFQRNQQMLMQTPPSVPALFACDRAAARVSLNAALKAERTMLDGSDARAILAAYGIVPVERGEAGPPLRLAAGVDCHFGPVLQFGQSAATGRGGRDQAVALPPLNPHLARQLIEETQVFRLLLDDGGASSATINEIALGLVKLSQLVCDLAEVRGVEIDPVSASAAGLVFADARIWIEATTGPAEARLAIRPYPVELERQIAMRDGGKALLRPIRPEDAPALKTFVSRLTPQDIRMRFFHQMKELDDRFAARLSQLDYDREMALIALDTRSPAGDGDAEILGVARISADPDGREAEYAVAVRSDLKGKGLGRLLMDEIIGYCRRRGIGEIWGQVLAENEGMLRLNRRLGFEERRDADDPSVMIVRLRLGP